MTNFTFKNKIATPEVVTVFVHNILQHHYALVTRVERPITFRNFMLIKRWIIQNIDKRKRECIVLAVEQPNYSVYRNDTVRSSLDAKNKSISIFTDFAYLSTAIFTWMSIVPVWSAIVKITLIRFNFFSSSKSICLSREFTTTNQIKIM